jgi:hypothetical protein
MPYWGQDSFRAHSGVQSIWPTRTGTNAVIPPADYPPNIHYSWLICGPYDFTDAKDIQASYWWWLDIPDSNDFVGLVTATDLNNFGGVIYWGQPYQWIQETFSLSQYAGVNNVYLAFVFESDANTSGPGVWIDDFHVTRTAAPAASVDLAVQMTAPTSGNVGQPLTYAISAVNNGAQNAVNTTLNFQSDTALFGDPRFYTINSSQGGCAPSDNFTATCYLNTLVASRTVTISVVITPTVLFPATITNTVQVTSTVPPPELNPADNQMIQTTSINLLRVGERVGRCWLTNYYDTTHFRIYYTRTTPNSNPRNADEQDCSIQTPDSLHRNGYPRAIVDMGDGLEASYTKYGGMSYQVDRTQLGGRYPVYNVGKPIWTCRDVSGGASCLSSASGLAYPDRILFQQDMTTPQNMDPNYGDPNADYPVDWIRATVAHEFFHAVQYTYFPSSGTNDPNVGFWQEATAAWAEVKVYPACGWCQDAEDLLNNPNIAITQAVHINTYPTFTLARYLEDKVANHSEAIILQTWQRFSSNGGNTLGAINDILAGYGGKSLTTEFPEFARNNYFLADGTYTRIYTSTVDVRREPTAIPTSRFQGSEWALFRSYFRDLRSDIANGRSGASTNRVDQYPWNGPVAYSTTVQSLSAGYIEYLPVNLPTGNVVLTVTVDINPSPSSANLVADISVLPLLDFTNGFVNGTHTKLLPTVINPTLSRYTFQINNFEQCNRVALIATGIDQTRGFTYSYHAEVASASPPLGAPCSLR